NSSGFVVEGVHFEEFGGGPSAIRLDQNLGGYIGSCVFVNASGAGSTGIWVSEAGTNAPSSGIVIGPNQWSNTDVLVKIDDTDSLRSCVVMPQGVLSAVNVAAKMIIPDVVNRGHVIYSATSNTTNLTAGVALPRLSGSKRDGMTASSSGGTRREGLTVYNDPAK